MQDQYQKFTVGYLVVTKFGSDDDNVVVETNEDNTNFLEYLDAVRRAVSVYTNYDSNNFGNNFDNNLTFRQYSDWNNNLINKVKYHYTSCYDNLEESKRFEYIPRIINEKIRRHAIVLQVLSWSNFKRYVYYRLCDHIGERDFKRSERTVAYVKINEKTFKIIVYLTNLFSKKEEEILNFFVDKGSSRITFREIDN